MKLFSNETIKISEMSVENFVDLYNNSSVVATEAISDYLYKIKDTFTNLSNSIVLGDNDKLALDVLNSRFELEHVIKRLKMSDIGSYSVEKPENFKGHYKDYTPSLIDAVSSTKRA